MNTSKVEFLLAWSDHTWTTEIWDVPNEIVHKSLASDLSLEDWATQEVDRRSIAQNRKNTSKSDVVYVGLYCLYPDENDLTEG